MRREEGMTEAGERWAFDCANKAWTEGDEPPAIPEHAEFWLRAFCDEVEKRAKNRAAELGVLVDVVRLEAFHDVRRELLGWK